MPLTCALLSFGGRAEVCGAGGGVTWSPTVEYELASTGEDDYRWNLSAPAKRVLSPTGT